MLHSACPKVILSDGQPMITSDFQKILPCLKNTKLEKFQMKHHLLLLVSTTLVVFLSGALAAPAQYAPIR